MTTAEIRDLYDECERRGAAYPRYRREETERLIRMISDSGDGNFVIYSKLGANDADAAIEGELEYFGKLGLGFEWKLYSHDQPSDLKKRLADKGFSVGDEEAIMALELERLPVSLLAASPHDIRRVADGKTLADYAEASEGGWPGDEDNAAALQTLEVTLRDDSERMSAYVAYVEDVPVCAARIEFPPASPFASLWGAATLEPYRRRGIYTAILAIRAREAIARGYRFLTIDAMPMSRAIVAKQGFQLLAASNPCDSPRG